MQQAGWQVLPSLSHMAPHMLQGLSLCILMHAGFYVTVLAVMEWSDILAIKRATYSNEAPSTKVVPYHLIHVTAIERQQVAKISHIADSWE